MKNRSMYKRKTDVERRAELTLATQDKKFVNACEAAGIPPSRRQWRKWCRGAGLAFATRAGAVKNVNADNRGECDATVLH